MEGHDEKRLPGLAHTDKAATFLEFICYGKDEGVTLLELLLQLAGLTMEQIKLLQTSIASTNIAARYKFVAKCLMGNIFDAVEQATAQLKDCEKVIMDGTVLLLNSHYGVAGTMSWETFSADMTEAIATKAAQAGAIAGAAAAAAHHAGAGAGDIQFG